MSIPECPMVFRRVSCRMRSLSSLSAKSSPVRAESWLKALIFAESRPYRSATVALVRWHYIVAYRGMVWSSLHVGMSIPIRPMVFATSVVSNAIIVFLSAKPSSACVVLGRFFPRFFLGLVFCGFLPKQRFSVPARTDGVLQRRVRRFSFEMRKKTMAKALIFAAPRPYRSATGALIRWHDYVVAYRSMVWSSLHVGMSIPICPMVFPMGVVSNAIVVFLSAKSSPVRAESWLKR